jgi:hypothetical protein
MKVNRINNRLIESTSKLIKLARNGEDIITSDSKDPTGLFIRLGKISKVTGKLGGHALYCRFKTQKSRPRCIRKLSEIYTKKAEKLPDQIFLREVMAILQLRTRLVFQQAGHC